MSTSSSAADRLPKPLLEALAEHGGVRQFPAHAILINAGDSTDSLYIVLSGRLRAYADVLGDVGTAIEDFLATLP